MVWEAVDAIADAWEATRTLVWPPVVRSWLVLGVVVFFVTGASTANPSINLNLGEPAVPWLSRHALGAGYFDPATLTLVVIAVSGFIAVSLAYGLVAAMLEFTFVTIARSKEVRLRGNVGPYFGFGLQLLLLRIAIGGDILVAAVAVTLLLGLLGGWFMLLLVLASPMLLVAGMVVWGVLRFTVDFVVPIMLIDEVGILQGWRRFATELRLKWWEYGLYAILRIILGIIATAVVSAGFILLAILLAIPFGIIGALAWLMAAAFLVEPAASLVLYGVGALYLVSAMLASVVVLHVPVQTYLRYYALLVLARVSPEWDVFAAESTDRTMAP